jgi:hypothetical protein
MLESILAIWLATATIRPMPDDTLPLVLAVNESVLPESLRPPAAERVGCGAFPGSAVLTYLLVPFEHEGYRLPVAYHREVVQCDRTGAHGS